MLPVTVAQASSGIFYSSFVDAIMFWRNGGHNPALFNVS